MYNGHFQGELTLKSREPAELFHFLVFSFPRQLDNPQPLRYSQNCFLKHSAPCPVSLPPGGMSISALSFPAPRSAPGHSDCAWPNSDHSRWALLLGKLPQAQLIFLSPFRGPQIPLGKFPNQEPQFLLGCPALQSTEQLQRKSK